MPRKITLYTISVLLIFALCVPNVSAQVVTHQQIKIDEKIIVEGDQSFSVPTSIAVLPIFPPSSDFNISDGDWFRGMYYYLIANDRRPGFTDIPFHYVVSRDGRVFKGNVGGEERKISIDGLGDQMVVIGYLAGRSDNAFDPRAEEALGELIVDIASRNAIPLNKVTVNTIEYVRDDAAQEISLTQKDLFGLWQTSMQGILADVAFMYKPVAKEYKVEVLKVEMPEEEISSGESVIGRITIKNIGDFGIYANTTSELLGSRKGGDSVFYLTNFWPSHTQFEFMSDGDVLLPGEEGTFDFRMNVPLFFGNQAEEFELANAAGTKIPNTTFSLELKVKKPEGTIVEVTETETGWLRVRSTPSGAATEVARISTGERFIQVEDAGNGWVKIKLNDGNEGWVSQQYLRYL